MTRENLLKRKEEKVAKMQQVPRGTRAFANNMGTHSLKNTLVALLIDIEIDN